MCAMWSFILKNPIFLKREVQTVASVSTIHLNGSLFCIRVGNQEIKQKKDRDGL